MKTPCAEHPKPLNPDVKIVTDDGCWLECGDCHWQRDYWLDKAKDSGDMGDGE